MKNRFSDFINGIIQNVIANVVVIIAIPIVGVIYAFSTNNPQITLLVVLIVLVVISIFINLRSLWMQRTMSQELKDFSPVKHMLPIVPENEDPITRQARHEFEITDKHFEETSSPQKLVIQFTNRGNDIIQVKKVKYSDNRLGLPNSAIFPSYRKESGGYYSIPFNPNSAEVAPSQSLLVEICLAQVWKREDINRMTGKWGYLKLDILYKDKPVEVFNSI